MGSDPNCSTCQRIATLTAERDGIWDQLSSLSPQIVSLQSEIDDLQAIIDNPESSALTVYEASIAKASKNQVLDRKKDRFEELGEDWRSKDDEINSMTNHTCPPEPEQPCTPEPEPTVTGHYETRQTWVVTGTEWVVTGGHMVPGDYLENDEFGNPVYGPDRWIEDGEWHETGYWQSEEVWVEA